MRKFIFIILFALTLVGCVKKTPEQINNEIVSGITEFEYKGHKYLLYDDKCGKYSIGGITHDPDCPCHQKENNHD